MAIEQVNLSEIDINSLPQRKTVYAILAQSKDTGKPINCRYVGETDNLRERTRAHFSKDEQNACLREFMQSDKTKLMKYELMPNSTKKERQAREKEWIKKHEPKCNE